MMNRLIVAARWLMSPGRAAAAADPGDDVEVAVASSSGFENRASPKTAAGPSRRKRTAIVPLASQAKRLATGRLYVTTVFEQPDPASQALACQYHARDRLLPLRDIDDPFERIWSGLADRESQLLPDVTFPAAKFGLGARKELIYKLILGPGRHSASAHKTAATLATKGREDVRLLLVDTLPSAPATLAGPPPCHVRIVAKSELAPHQAGLIGQCGLYVRHVTEDSPDWNERPTAQNGRSLGVLGAATATFASEADFDLPPGEVPMRSAMAPKRGGGVFAYYTNRFSNSIGMVNAALKEDPTNEGHPMAALDLALTNARPIVVEVETFTRSGTGRGTSRKPRAPFSVTVLALFVSDKIYEQVPTRDGFVQVFADLGDSFVREGLAAEMGLRVPGRRRRA
jgi:hypothetical protein